MLRTCKTEPANASVISFQHNIILCCSGPGECIMSAVRAYEGRGDGGGAVLS